MSNIYPDCLKAPVVLFCCEAIHFARRLMVLTSTYSVCCHSGLTAIDRNSKNNEDTLRITDHFSINYIITVVSSYYNNNPLCCVAYNVMIFKETYYVVQFLNTDILMLYLRTFRTKLVLASITIIVQNNYYYYEQYTSCRSAVGSGAVRPIHFRSQHWTWRPGLQRISMYCCLSYQTFVGLFFRRIPAPPLLWMNE